MILSSLNKSFEYFHDIFKVLFYFKCNCKACAFFFLAFYHCRIAVAEYTIDGVPGMNIRLCFMKSPLVVANDNIDVNHHNMKTIHIDDNIHQVAITV